MFFFFISSPGISAPIDLFWVGGTGNTNDSAHYSLTSGGSSAGVTPTSAYDTIWDGNSGGGTTTVNATLTTNDFLTAGYTGTIAGSSAMTVGGSFSWGSGITRSYTGAITFSATTTGKTITYNGKTSASALTFDGVGGGWVVQDNLNNTTSSIVLTNGSLDTNGKAITCFALTSNNSNVRSLTCGASTFAMTGGVTFTTSTNFTVSAASATFNFSGNVTADWGDLATTVGAINFTSNTASTSSPALVNRSASDMTIGTLTRTNSSTQSSLALSGNFTITTTLTFTGNDVRTARVAVFSANPGTAVQLTATGATKSFTNTDFQGITAVGNTPWTGTSMGDGGGNTGITFDSPVTCYLIAHTSPNNFYVQQNWSSSSGGATNTVRNPLPQDTIVIDGNSFNGAGLNLSLNGANVLIPTLDFTNATNNPTLAVVSTVKCVGDLTIIAGMTVNNSGIFSFAKWSGTQTLTSGGVSFSCPIAIQTGGTFVNADAYTGTASITYSSGTWDDGDFNITASSITISNTTLNAAKVFNKGIGTYTLTSISGTVWNASGIVNLTFTDSGTTKITGGGSSNKTFAGGGLTYNIVWNDTGSTGAVIYTGNNTYAQLKSTSGAARTNSFVGGSTHTIADLDIDGTAGNNTVLSRSSGSGTYTWNLTTPQTCDRITVSNLNVTGETLTLTNSTDGGGNTGNIVFS